MTELDERKLDPAVALASLDATAPREPHRLFALKQGDCFAVADAYGDIRGAGDGFFRDDTRVLSEFRLTVGGRQTSLLGASLSQDNVLFTSNLTNLPMQSAGGRDIPQGAIHIERVRLLWQDRLFERITLANYSREHTTIAVSLHFAADFRDMFEVRGSTRPKRGLVHAAEMDATSVLLRYDGLDGLARLSAISFSQAPDQLTADRADFLIAVTKRSSKVLYVEVGPEVAEAPDRDRFRAAAARARFGMRAKRRHGATMHSSGPRLQRLGRARSRGCGAADHRACDRTLPLCRHSLVFDGVRPRRRHLGAADAVARPGLARGVLAFLAQHQATETSPFSDSQPGKIMHETRKGEMVALRELPFGRYYGGVDTTPLYIHLACAYADRTGDMAFIDSLWPSLCAAAEWMEAGKPTATASSPISVPPSPVSPTRAGRTASIPSSTPTAASPRGRSPWSRCRAMSLPPSVAWPALARRRGDNERAEHWESRAEAMRAAVERDFWLEDLGFYALGDRRRRGALQGAHVQCRAICSMSGLPAPDAGADGRRPASFGVLPFGLGTADPGRRCRLLQPDVLSQRFDLAARHRHLRAPAWRAMASAKAWSGLMSGTFESAVHFNMRLPELFCGFTRAPGEAPIAYPVACLPQAWSAGSVFMLMQACLGLEIDGWDGEIRVTRPRLPIGIDTLTMRHLGVGATAVDLTFQRVGDRVVAFLADRHEGLVPLIVRT